MFINLIDIIKLGFFLQGLLVISLVRRTWWSTRRAACTLLSTVTTDKPARVLPQNRIHIYIYI